MVSNRADQPQENQIDCLLLVTALNHSLSLQTGSQVYYTSAEVYLFRLCNMLCSYQPNLEFIRTNTCSDVQGVLAKPSEMF